MIVGVRRIPRDKKFVVYIYKGATRTDDVGFIEVLCRNLPRGGWAQYADRWAMRRPASGKVFYSQANGYFVNDPLVQLELELMIDTTSDLSL